MITIAAVRVGGGLYLGLTFSDQWNLFKLLDLGRELGLQLDINKCTSKGQIDRLRRTLKGLGFLLRVRSKGRVLQRPTPAESAAMETPYRGSYPRMSMRKSS